MRLSHTGFLSCLELNLLEHTCWHACYKGRHNDSDLRQVWSCPVCRPGQIGSCRREQSVLAYLRASVEALVSMQNRDSCIRARAKPVLDLSCIKSLWNRTCYSTLSLSQGKIPVAAYSTHCWGIPGMDVVLENGGEFPDTAWTSAVWWYLLRPAVSV